jgi:hypothetical protein
MSRQNFPFASRDTLQRFGFVPLLLAALVLAAALPGATAARIVQEPVEVAPQRNNVLAQALPNCPAPAANQVVVYAGYDFTAQCAVKNIGGYPNPESLGLPTGIRSLRVGSSVHAVVYGNDYYQHPGWTDSIYSDKGEVGNDIVSGQSLQVRPNPECQRAQEGQVVMFAQPDFWGECETHGLGLYPNPGLMGLGANSLSSLQVGDGVHAVICREDGYGGICQVFYPGELPRLTGTLLGNNTANSMHIRPNDCPQPSGNQVTIYQEAHYWGECRVKNIGDYSNPAEMGLPNDSLSSIQVGWNVEAVVCRDDDFKGACETFRSDVRDFRGTYQDPRGTRVGNDHASSLRVRER